MFFLPIRTDVRLVHLPWMNWLLIALNVVVFIIQQMAPEQAVSRWTLNALDPRLATFFTYAFLHQGIGHIGANMLFLYAFGNNVNDRMGHAGYLGFYLAGGVFAGIGHVMTASLPVLGASGAVAAVIGAFLVLFPRSNVTFFYFVIVAVGTFEVSSVLCILFFFVQDLIPFLAKEPSGVAHTAHLSGTIFGVTMSFLMMAVHLLPRDPYDVVSLLSRWRRRREYRSMVSQGYDPFGQYAPATVPPVTPNEMLPDDPLRQKMLTLRTRIAEAIARHDLASAAALYVELTGLDRKQVLSRQAQLDVANQLASQQAYPEAADAYERFLEFYPNYEQVEQVELMLGLIYSRYLSRYDRAKECLLRAAAHLHGAREAELARAELEKIKLLGG